MKIIMASHPQESEPWAEWIIRVSYLQEMLALAHSLCNVELVELEVCYWVHQRWLPLRPRLCLFLHTTNTHQNSHLTKLSLRNAAEGALYQQE